MAIAKFMEYKDRDDNSIQEGFYTDGKMVYYLNASSGKLIVEGSDGANFSDNSGTLAKGLVRIVDAESAWRAAKFILSKYPNP